jgi:hypothetical protein
MAYIGSSPAPKMPSLDANTVETEDIQEGAVTASKLAPGAAVPEQTGQTGKFLKTDGTTASWQNIPSSLPVLTTLGTTVFISTAAGYLPVLTTGGTTVNVAVS